MTIAPTLDDLDDLGVLLRLEVPPEFEDLNGHVNVRHHYAMHMEGVEKAFVEQLGVDEARAALGDGTFSLTHHIVFHSEILIGHEVSVHLRLLDRSDKIIHAMTILANRTTGRVASTIEFIEAHVDLTARRVTLMGEDLASALDDLIDRHRGLTWDLPLSQPLGVRGG